MDGIGKGITNIIVASETSLVADNLRVVLRRGKTARNATRYNHDRDYN